MHSSARGEHIGRREVDLVEILFTVQLNLKSTFAASLPPPPLVCSLRLTDRSAQYDRLAAAGCECGGHRFVLSACAGLRRALSPFVRARPSVPHLVESSARPLLRNARRGPSHHPRHRKVPPRSRIRRAGLANLPSPAISNPESRQPRSRNRHLRGDPRRRRARTRDRGRARYQGMTLNRRQRRRRDRRRSRRGAARAPGADLAIDREALNRSCSTAILFPAPWIGPRRTQWVPGVRTSVRQPTNEGQGADRGGGRVARFVVDS